MTRRTAMCVWPAIARRARHLTPAVVAACLGSLALAVPSVGASNPPNEELAFALWPCGNGCASVIDAVGTSPTAHDVRTVASSQNNNTTGGYYLGDP
jgi:hypothetical protein